MMLVGYYSLMPNLESDLPEVLAAIRKAGCRTALDTAGDGGTMQPLDRILPQVDVYVPSHNEATHQTGHEDPRKIIEAYRSCGAAGLLGVKLGSKGALLSPAAGQYVSIECVPPPGPVVDTTGAGDSFFAGLLTGLLKGLGRRMLRPIGGRGRRLLRDRLWSDGGLAGLCENCPARRSVTEATSVWRRCVEDDSTRRGCAAAFVPLGCRWVRSFSKESLAEKAPLCYTRASSLVQIGFRRGHRRDRASGRELI